ncbi:MAG: hypothetical protein N2746_02310 [Deltaproteobacteria bacterium]|nr:hypothetical protein [Deltaproteobacteria bacterium]
MNFADLYEGRSLVALYVVGVGCKQNGFVTIIHFSVDKMSK